jgi:hypothetical protein
LLKKIIALSAIITIAGIGAAQAQNTSRGSIDQPGVGQQPTRGESGRTARNAPYQGSNGSAAAVTGGNDRGGREVNPSGGGAYSSPNNPAPMGTQR